LIVASKIMSLSMGSQPHRIFPVFWILGFFLLFPASQAFRTIVPLSSQPVSFFRCSHSSHDSALRDAKWRLSLSAASAEDEEWYPHDPAWTTPQLLEGIWSQIALAKDLVRGVRDLCFVLVAVLPSTVVSLNVALCRNRIR
jgi:hypothetical protein